MPVGHSCIFLARGLQGFGESIYLIDRLKMLTEGGRPYKDFEYAYGAIFLYGPRALMLLHLSAEDSYYVFWLLTLLVGVWMLAEVIGLAGVSGRPKIRSIFSSLPFRASRGSECRCQLHAFSFSPGRLPGPSRAAYGRREGKKDTARQRCSWLWVLL